LWSRRFTASKEKFPAMNDLEYTCVLIGLFLFVALSLRGLQRWLDHPKSDHQDARQDRRHHGPH
jgi:hypothetical protein